MNISTIQFPVYYLGSVEPQQSEGVVFYYYEKHSTEDRKQVIQVIDDKNIQHGSLATRRIELLKKGIKPYRLKYAVFFLADLLKLTKGTTWFIDNEGTVFSYKKTKYVPLVFKRISSITPIKTGGAIVEVERIGTRFKVLHAPTGKEKYAGLLCVGASYILYGLYEKRLEDTTRMI